MWFQNCVPNQTPVTIDVIQIGLLIGFLILLLSFLISIPTSEFYRNVSVYARTTFFLTVGLCLLFSNFDQEWEVSSIASKTPYKAGSHEIVASIGLKIGLRGFNITLKSDDNVADLKDEIINYNERFTWAWDQGRLGFGPFAGQLQQEYRAAQYRGIPIPILWITNYFVIDGENFRWGRFYRLAGWYSHVALWSAFACWLIALILLRIVIRYGAYLLAASGALQLTANFLWLFIRNPIELQIPFEDQTITTTFGRSYWINFVSGLVSIIVATIILIFDWKYDSALHLFFNVDPLNTYDGVVYISKSEQIEWRKKIKSKVTNMDVESTSEILENDEADYDNIYIPVYKKRCSFYQNLK